MVAIRLFLFTLYKEKIMNTTINNISAIGLAVKAAFGLTLDGQRVSDAIKVCAQQVPYEFGIFAEQDVRALVSMYYTLVYQLVGLQSVTDRPLQDAPKEGSLEWNDTGRADEQALAREEAIQQCLRGIAVLGRHLRSLHSKAVKDTEEAGNRTNDGGRLRFNFKSTAFKPYAKSLEEILIDMRAETPAADVRRLAQIDMAADLNPPVVAETDAGQEFMDYMDPMKLVAGSVRAANAVIDQLIDLGDILVRHEARMAELNAERNEANLIVNREQRKLAVDSVMSRMAMERNQYRLDTNRPLWMLKQRLSPVAFLRHEGALRELTESAEWRAAEALERAKMARIKVVEAQAATTEIEATMAEQEANMALYKARQQQLAMQRALDAQSKEFAALVAGNKPVSAKAPVKAKPKAKAPVKAKPKLVKQEAKPMPHLGTMAGAAGSFRPRG